MQFNGNVLRNFLVLKRLFLLLTACVLFTSVCATGNDGEKILHFPNNSSLGRLYLLPEEWTVWFSDAQKKAAQQPREQRWNARATGSVTVSKRAKLLLQVEYPVTNNPSLLTACGADAFAGLDLRPVTLDDKAIAKISELSGLQALQLDDLKVSDRALMPVAKLKSLKFLSLANAPITDRGLDCLIPLAALTRLRLDGTRVSDDGLRSIEKCRQLQVLGLVGCNISDAAVGSLATTLPELRELNLDNTRVTAKGLSRLGGLEKLEFLSVRNTGVTARDLRVIQKLVRSMPHLKSIRVDDTSFTSAAVTQWQHAFPGDIIDLPRLLHFPERTSLGRLHRLENTNEDGGMLVTTDFGEARGTVRVPKEALLFLDVGYDAAQDPSLMTSYGSDFFAGFGFRKTETDDQTIAKISVLTGLRALDLRDADITDQALKSLAKLPKLQDLSLFNTPITDRGIASLGALHSLQSLNVNQTKTGDLALKSLQQCQNLQYLSAERCPLLTDAGLHSLSTLAKLHHVILTKNHQLTATGLLQLIPLKHLSCLELEHTGVTAKDLPLMQKLTRQISSLDRILVADRSFTPAVATQWQQCLPVMLRVVAEKDPNYLREDAPAIFAPMHY